MLFKFRLALLCCLSSATLALAQAPDIRMDRLSVSEGLSHDKVLTVLQDRMGFMWFGTLDGLNRYDGYSFTTFQNSPLDPASLPGDVVYALLEDREGVLWIGTSGGLSRLDRSTGRFTNYLIDRDFVNEPWANDVGYLYEDREGILWIGTFGGGLYQMNRATGALTHYMANSDDATSLSFNVVEAIHEDRSGVLWVSTMDGLNRFERATGTFTRFLYPADDRYSGSVVAFAEDTGTPGVFWLSTIAGLVRFVPETGTTERFIDFQYSTTLQGGPWWSMPRGIVADPHVPGVLWVAVPREGLYRFDTESGKARLYRQDHDDPNSLSGEPHSLFVDATGMIWVGTNRGVNRFDPALSRFRHYVSGLEGSPPLLHRNVSALHEDRSGRLWVGTGDFLVGTALSRIDPVTGAVSHWQPPPSSPEGLPDNISINTIHEDRAGFIWIGTTPREEEPALTRLDLARGTVRHWRHDPRNPNGIGSGAVLEVYEDRAGLLWVGTSDGWLSRMDAGGETFTHVRHGADDTTSLSSGAVRVILEDHAGRLWVGTDGGLNRLDRATGALVRYRHDPNNPDGLSSNSVFALFERVSEPGILWVSTSAALDRLDVGSGTVTHFSTREGLPKHPVVAMLEDSMGRLWMSTAGSGLLCFDPATGRVLTFDETNGVQARRFNLGAAVAGRRTGDLMFGGVDGFNAFNPRQVGGRSAAPPVVLTDFKLFGQSVAVGARSVLRQPIWDTREIRLTHAQDAVAFDFVAPHYKNPSKNRYAYRLEGFDDDWVMAGDRRTASYTNLSPGRYVFRVRAASSEGVWNETGAAVRLVILPPWWRTWWAYAVFALLLTGTAVSLDRLRQWQVIRRERERSLLREKELRAETAEAWASYLQAENRRQTQELESARTLQMSMLPKHVPLHPAVEIAAHMKTATEVGGDYYDFNVTADGTLTAIIGDATGHGAQAGTMVTAVKGLFMGFSDEPELVQVLDRLAHALKRMALPKLYMALALARLHGRCLELVGAGMPPALVYRAGSKCVERVPLKGLPLGAPGDAVYQPAHISLAPGDTVVLMSDGFPELFNGEGGMFGYEEAVQVFEQIAGASPEAIIERLSAVAAEWMNGKPQNDDMTFVVLRLRDSM